MNLETDIKSEASDVSAWISLYHRTATINSNPLVGQEDYEALVNGITDRRDRAIILVLMESGLRANELVQLDKDMITTKTHDLPDGSIETVGIGSVPTTKNGRQPRQFFLSGKTMKALSNYLLEDRNRDTHRVLFAVRLGRRLKPASIGRMLYKSCDRLGIERFGLHEFRRSLAAQLCESGCDLRAIKSALGYRKTQTLVDLISQSNPKAN
ncbi:MAG: tyrosine-type recombinase/integrase [Acidobacteriaceae bacterium]